MARTKSVNELESEFLDRIGKISKQWGLGEPAGRIWASMLFAGESMTQKDISKKTGYSLSLISPNLKILENLNMIRTVKNGRENKYEVVGSFTETFNQMVYRFMEHDIKPLITKLEAVKTEDTEDKKRVERLVSE